MKQTVAVATLTARPGESETLRGCLERLRAIAAQEPGTLEWVLFRAQQDPAVFVIVERFADEHAYLAHENNPELASVTPGLRAATEKVEVRTGAALPGRES
ncbi:putative quinol monooxygenase [Phytohabitans suffuscus]|uniref:ABM domain-containing protein n=1 Tax=Phytohabitans suffuscus TaxID=624315 RepID=A0A6F8YRF0_9ACTN|nr:antibiotic biosynthesis monooxygenase family protein [Phytohabitans suffuscus]BCB88636.1 hypothetical protein Psuf_059490 [Phytohabitans suffuscus]